MFVQNFLGGTIISDIGLDAALGELSDLENLLNDLKDSQKSNTLFSGELTSVSLIPFIFR